MSSRMELASIAVSGSTSRWLFKLDSELMYTVMFEAKE